jgi:hypothetical protein
MFLASAMEAARAEFERQEENCNRQSRMQAIGDIRER